MYFKKMKFFLIMCLIMMMLGVILGINSTSWLMMWLSMEINLMFFIPQLMLNKSMAESYTCLKYFIFQSLGSIFFILGSMDFFFFNTFGLFLKLGLFPVHFWMLSISKNLNWLNFFYLMTIQKFLPLMFLIFSLKFTMSIFLTLFLFNSFIGNVGSMNQMDLRMFMTFSSMNHISWMIMSTGLNMIFFYLYFLFYSLLMYFFYLIFNKIKVFYLFQLFYFKNFFLSYKFLMFFMLFFSFMGFPPFMGFFLKLISMTSLLNFFMFLFMFIMLMQNLFISFSYMRVMIFLFLNVSRSIKMNKLNLKKYFNLINLCIFFLLL